MHTITNVGSCRANHHRPGRSAITAAEVPQLQAAAHETGRHPPIAGDDLPCNQSQPTSLVAGLDSRATLLVVIYFRTDRRVLGCTLQNASLAVELAAAWEAGAGQHLPGHQEAAAARLEQLARNVLPDAYLQGIQSCEWPGRSQVCSPLTLV